MMSKSAMITFLQEVFIGVVGIVFIAILVFGSLQPPNPEPPYPRLIGTSCYGTDGPVWAYEEDEFPTDCEVIKKYI